MTQVNMGTETCDGVNEKCTSDPNFAVICAFLAEFGQHPWSHHGQVQYQEKIVEVVDGTIDGPVLVQDHGLLYEVDVFQGHKTGHYLDQSANRLKAAKLASGGRVLDGRADGGEARVARRNRRLHRADECRRRAPRTPPRAPMPAPPSDPGRRTSHNYIGHNYIGHNHIGHNCIGHNYIYMAITISARTAF